MSATIRHTINDSGESVLLKLGELVSIRVAPGQMVRCRSGSVWITVDNGGHDHVLNGGNQLTVRARGCMVIEALMLSEVMLLPQYESADRRPIMKLINKSAPHTGNRKIWNVDVNKDSVASALVLAASLFILLFVSATAAMQSDGVAAVAPAKSVEAQSGADAQKLAARVFANIERNSRCHSAKLC